jgi:hypothetical protein
MLNIQKHKLIARVIVPLLAVASFFGCSSALEGDIPGGAGTGGPAASVQKVSAYPASLAGTDWGGAPDVTPPAEPRYVVLSFTAGSGTPESGTGVLLLSSSDDPDDFGYDYDASSGNGVIYTATYGDGKFSIDVNTNVMTFILPDLAAQDYYLNLIVPRLPSINGTVWNTITPRNIYSSIDFETDTVQTTFGDGTFPLYDLLFYDGISAGLIRTMGLFYLDYNSDGVLTVVFPDFYRYHMGVPVIYTPSENVLSSVDGTVWATKNADETVTFTGGYAVFKGADNFTAPYLYNDKQAGAAGVPPGTVNDAGSFLVAANGSGNPLTLTFFNYKSRANPPVPLVFYKQIQPLEDEASAKE